MSEETEIVVEVEEEAWSLALPDADILVYAAAVAALEACELDGPVGGLTVLLTNDDAVAELNDRFRGKPQPTNVLSFPSAPNPEAHLGDIALAYGVCAREAAEQDKSLADHLQHLTAHGVLHLLGFDHETDDEAEEMEALERDVLEGIGVPDPYLAP
jgi:probable rRNA maturation factor